MGRVGEKRLREKRRVRGGEISGREDVIGRGEGKE